MKNQEEKETAQVKRFGEVFAKAFESASIVRFRDVAGRDIIIKDYAERYGKSGKFFVVLASDPDSNDDFSFVVYNSNIQRKIARAKQSEQLPLIGKIIDNDGYYDII